MMRVWLEYFVKLTQTYVCNGRIKKDKILLKKTKNYKSFTVAVKISKHALYEFLQYA